MSCLISTLCIAESLMSWRIEFDTGETASAVINFFMNSICSGSACVLHCSLTLMLSSRDEQQRIADVFLSRRAEFLVFTTYIGHYDRSVSLLEDSCRASPALSALVHQFEVSLLSFTCRSLVFHCVSHPLEIELLK